MQPVMTYKQYYMQYFLLYDDDLSKASFRSVGKMGSVTRVGPGNLKLKPSPGTVLQFPKKIFSNGRTLGININELDDSKWYDFITKT